MIDSILFNHSYYQLSIYLSINLSIHLSIVSSIGIEGVLDVLMDLKGDLMITQLNLSYNILPEEFFLPARVQYFLRELKKALYHNHQLTALDLAGESSSSSLSL